MREMPTEPQEKWDRLAQALERGTAMIHVDARRPGVRVPAHMGRELHLRLNLSRRFDPPDLKLNAWGVFETLSFSGRRFACAVPWPAIFAISSAPLEEMWLFSDDVPPELLRPMEAPAEQAERKGSKVARKLAARVEELGAAGPLKVLPKPLSVCVEGAQGEGPDAAVLERPPVARAEIQRGHLRLVK